MVPVVCERLLVRGVELGRVALRIEHVDAQPGRPGGWERRRVQLDAHLAEDAHHAVAERLEQPARGGVHLEDAVLDPARAVPGGLLLELGRQQLADAASARDGVDVSLHAPEVAPLLQHAVSDDAVAAVPDHPRVALEIEVGPLLLQVGLRERGRAVRR
jgi:hypothetical protein